MARQEWFSSQELAGLPGMPRTYSAVIRWAQKNLAASRGKPRGKGLEYARASLPAETQAWLNKRDMDAALALMSVDAPDEASTLPATRVTNTAPAQAGGALVTPAGRTAPALAVRAPADNAHATTAARVQAVARKVAVQAMKATMQAHGCSARAAAMELHRAALAGELPPAVMTPLCGARDKRGRPAANGLGVPSLPTLQKWAAEARRGGDLTPRPSAEPDRTVRAWFAPLYALMDRPQKPTLKWAWEKLLENWRAEWEDPAGSGQPSYDRARAAHVNRSEIDKLKGRHTGSALRAHTFYQHRRYDDLVPAAEVHADGWNTHFTAPHPVTGAFVTYEVWHAHDTATRWVPPFAVGLSESSTVIHECLRQTVVALGLVAIFQTDHTRSIKNHATLDELTGLGERIGVSVLHPVAVGNSNANGIAENFNTWLDMEARELATYQHPERMDSGTFVKMRRITGAMVRAATAQDSQQRDLARQQAQRLGKGLVFESHGQALAWLEERRQKYNAHHHRSLPKVRDEATGRLRHMSPNEALAAARAAGWEPLALSAAELADAFRPHYRKTVTRGTVTPYGGMRYRDPLLDHILGEEVLVAVDEDDFAQVWVKDLAGRLICVAQFVEAVSGRSETMRQHAERKRAEARIRLRENQIDQIEASQARPALEMDDGSRALTDGLGALRHVPKFVGAGTSRLPGAAPVVRPESGDEPVAPDDDGPDPLALYQAKRRAQEVRAAEEAREAQQRAIAAALAQPRLSDDDLDDWGFKTAAG